MTWDVTMFDQPCDRCKRVADRLKPYKLVGDITYYNRVIVDPWLCLRCFKVEKRKWRAAQEVAP